MQHLFLTLANEPGFSEMARNLGYAGIFLWYISLDQVTPVPEEITLLSIGYLSSIGTFNPVLAGAIALLAFLLVDSAYYFLSRSGNSFFKKRYSKRHRPFMDKYKNNLKEHLPRTLIILCFIPRMRMFGPIFVGLLKLPFKRFLLFDAIGLSLFTALYISLGMIFGHSLALVSLRHWIFAGAMLVLALLVVFFLRHNRDHKKS